MLILIFLSIICVNFGFRAPIIPHVAVPVIAMSDADNEATDGVQEASEPQTASSKLGISVDGMSSSMERSELNAAIAALERTSPTENPAESHLVNGVWEVISAGYGSPGLIAYQLLKMSPLAKIGDLTVTISRTQPRVTAEFSMNIASRMDVSFQSTAELEAKTGEILEERFSSLVVGGTELPRPKESVIAKLSRELVVTYLDDDIMIVRDKLGSPEILRRQIFTGRMPDETIEPDASDLSDA